MSEVGSVGARILRPRDAVFLRGRARYVDDIDVPRLRHVAFVRSTQAHARIRRIRSDYAVAIPGVLAVLTLTDLQRIATSPRMPLIAAPGGTSSPATPYILAAAEVAIVGEPVSTVIAETRYAAEDGAGQLEVEYEPLPTVTDLSASIAIGACLVRSELSSNVLST